MTRAPGRQEAAPGWHSIGSGSCLKLAGRKFCQGSRGGSPGPMQSWVLLQGVGRGGKERGTCSCQDRGEGGTGTVVTWPSELSSSESCWVP